MGKIPTENYMYGIIDFVIGVAIIFFLQVYHSRVAAFALFLAWPVSYIWWFWTELFTDTYRFISALIFLYLCIRTCQATYKSSSGILLNDSEISTEN
jgi:hypothetical protein